jgi:hypothetical protein
VPVVIVISHLRIVQGVSTFTAGTVRGRHRIPVMKRELWAESAIRAPRPVRDIPARSLAVAIADQSRGTTTARAGHATPETGDAFNETLEAFIKTAVTG